MQTLVRSTQSTLYPYMVASVIICLVSTVAAPSRRGGIVDISITQIKNVYEFCSVKNGRKIMYGCQFETILTHCHTGKYYQREILSRGSITGSNGNDLV